jgi:hypothetical protein
MVHRTITLALLGVLAASVVRADLQFDAKVADYELEGMKLKELVFSDGSGKKITYSPPNGWSWSGNLTKLTLWPNHVPQAAGTISRQALSQPGTFDAESVKRLTESALAAVPNGSTEVTIVSQEKNPLIIERKETFLITLSYTFGGEKFGSSTLFLNRGTEQVRFQFVSRQSDFNSLQRAFQGSQYSWQNL